MVFLPVNPRVPQIAVSVQVGRKTRRGSSAAADRRSFSSLPFSPIARLSSLFTPQPNPPPSDSRNPYVFTIPAETSSSNAENSLDESKIVVAKSKLLKFFKSNCNSGNLSADKSFGFFHRMVQMEPGFALISFNLLLDGLAKNKRYSDVYLLYGKMNSVGLIPNSYTHNILLNCFFNGNRVCYGFAFLGSILRKGYSPDIVTFNSLIKGLCNGSKIDEAIQLFLKLETFGCRPNIITCGTLIHGLCRSGNTSEALRLLEEMVSGNGPYGVRMKPDVICYSLIIDGLCKEGKEDKAMTLFLEMIGKGLSPNVVVYSSLMNGLCCVGKWKEALDLYDEMIRNQVKPDRKTYSILLSGLFRAGEVEDAKKLLAHIQADRPALQKSSRFRGNGIFPKVRNF